MSCRLLNDCYFVLTFTEKKLWNCYEFKFNKEDKKSSWTKQKLTEKNIKMS